jgi:hypothetical protein
MTPASAGPKQVTITVNGKDVTGWLSGADYDTLIAAVGESTGSISIFLFEEKPVDGTGAGKRLTIAKGSIDMVDG